MRLLFDAEADGLLHEATQVWCICTMDIDTKQAYSFYQDNLYDAYNYLLEADELIGHNIIGYDLPLFNKLDGWE